MFTPIQVWRTSSIKTTIHLNHAKQCINPSWMDAFNMGSGLTHSFFIPNFSLPNRASRAIMKTYKHWRVISTKYRGLTANSQNLKKYIKMLPHSKLHHFAPFFLRRRCQEWAHVNLDPPYFDLLVIIHARNYQFLIHWLNMHLHSSKWKSSNSGSCSRFLVLQCLSF